ncbi:acetyl-CoA synthetase-like protein [Aaosphaeria arxii CBS 175.79]|uniref:Acetyl-CoA synthetase-like protein n=1 Tax=Aaosphaeria arxii CBS 175.79 TaxID=1450172 RepID=A0A6A5XNC3_9PLEO|nr:acetyl-CoA synthetase-like protein [Aaosphaeria arxii CBS 175.79]KAF2014423.1 acetyl-CoA synthetase-like protein [Aaosphaeria arxii CBS 175.79]
MTRSPTALLALQEISYALDIPINSIDVQKDLLSNGANSITLVRLHYALKTIGIHMKLETMVSEVTIEQLLGHLAQRSTTSVSPCNRFFKRKAVAKVESPSKRNTAGVKPEITNTSILKYNLRYPMTEIQLTLLQSSLENPGSNIISYHETHLPRDVPTLRAAWAKVLQLEPLLNSSYILEGSKAYIVERNHNSIDWEEVIVADTKSYNREINKQDKETPIFGHCFRVVTLAPHNGNTGRSRIIWRVHHGLIDGYSHLLLLSRLEKALLGAALGPTAPFFQFAENLRKLQNDSAASGMTYWAKRHVEHDRPASRLLLPTPAKSLALRGECNIFERSLDHSILATSCKKIGITFPTLYYAAWALTMARFTDSSDVLFGTVFNGRSLPIAGSNSVIGPTINTLPVHIRIDSSLTVAQYLRDVFRDILELNSMQWTIPNHGFSRNFQTALNIQNTPHFVRRSLLPIETPFSTIRSDVPLQVEIVRGTTDLIRFHYQLEHFNQCQIETISEVFTSAITIVLKPDATVGSCLTSIVDSTHRNTLSCWGNWNSIHTRTASFKDDLVTLFQRTASQYPSAIAIQKGSQTMSYKELDLKSSSVARAISANVEVGDVVCVHADRSFNWIIAIYGVLKAGAIYCPLVDTLSASIRDSNFLASGAKVFVAGKKIETRHKPAFSGKTITVEDILLGEYAGGIVQKNVSAGPHPDRGAYLCFTSGSTGKPKGVLCHHRGLVAFQRDFDVRLQARPGWKIAQVMSAAFDGSIHEIFSTFSYGATLLLGGSKGINHLMGADAAILTPSVARALDVQSLPSLKTVYFVGEAVTQDLCDSWASEKTVFNMYGPTEATCGATIKRLHQNHLVSLGAPNPSTRIYVLDSAQRLAPLGVIGEIYLAGVQVASGYVANRKDTETRFLFDSVNPQFDERMYKTGDKAYWNEGGELVLLGRSDRQVKLRGFRIDLDGLEVQFLDAQEKGMDVSQVAIVVNDGDLVAYVQPESADVNKLRQSLRTRLAHYAMPRWIVPIDSFPMTSAGKRDYKKLESSAQYLRVQSDIDIITENVTLLEDLIISILRETLILPDDVLIPPTSNFIDLGANSVSLLSLSHHISKALCRKVPLQSVMQSSTPQDLAWTLSISELDAAGNEPESDGLMLGEENVSPIEADWWYKYKSHHDTSAFSVSFACKLGAEVDVPRLMKAWDRVLSQHRILRCNYRSEPDGRIVRTYANNPPKTCFRELFDLDTEMHVPFNLEKGNLIRVICSPKTMLVVISHILCDLTTLDNLLNQVARIYAFRDPQYSNMTYSQTRWNKSITCAQRAFWTTCFDNIRPFSFRQNDIPTRSTWVGDSHLVRIPNLTFSRMKKYTAIQKATMHQLALAAVSLALQPDQRDKDIVIGAPYLNRNPESEMGTIGLFLQPLPIRIKYSGKTTSSSDTSSYIRAVQLASRDAVSHALPFHQLLSILDDKFDTPKSQLLDFMVTFHDAGDMPKLDVPGVEPINTWTRGAKFKLMAEFTAMRDGSLMLRLEYSTECFTKAEAEIVGNRIVASLEGLITKGTLEEIRQ